ncbi:MAG: 4-(cytidine 5'-diphospho)-2-C-methyl-D-erythritol kinase [Verrucomicrobiae bacterium]|nr:4-(cytidine 5'-diphospho)-2-C-methyl-D-erythritol kinase [Verrucomicrobiae bacterium]
MEPISLPSPAKVNLYLKILGKRPDGFHELETVMAALTLADEMRYESRVSRITLECNAPGVPTDDTNLVIRAAKLLQAKTGTQHGAHIVLQKRTPVGGGMGGGSSNGATTLAALNKLWTLNLSLAELRSLAAQLGSDVPFFLQPSVAICRGRGEIIEPLPTGQFAALKGLAVVLLNPGFGVPTPWAYQAYAARGGAEAEPKQSVQPLLHSLSKGNASQVAAQLYNSLEAPVFNKYPILEIFKRSLVEAGAVGAMMSGSGATVFGLCESEETANAVSGKVAAKLGASLWTHVARFAV